MEYIFLGLGNPKEYISTRHNIGKDFVIDIVNKNKGKWIDIKGGEISNLVINNKEYVFVISNGYMNEIGNDIKDFLSTIDKNKLVVIHDDIDIEVGKGKISFDRNSGGHNGVQSVIDTIKSKKFKRIRIGVGKEDDIKKHVLDKIPDEDYLIIAESLKKYFLILINDINTIE